MTSVKALLLGATVLFAPNLAGAEILDLSTNTCAQFLAKDGDETRLILTWMDGYYKEEKDPPIINTETFVANAKKLGDYCRANPRVGLITAADRLFSK